MAWETTSPSSATTVDDAPRRIFQGALPGQIIAFIHDAAQRNARLLHRTDIA